MLQILRTPQDLRVQVTTWRAQGLTVGLVPTMGDLHDGHLSLVTTALGVCDRVIVTLFVNPKQFNDPKDLAAYAQTETSDAAKLDALGADLLFAPDVETIYPIDFQTRVLMGPLAQVLDGAVRPGHFDGVTTVVAKLFNLAGADTAFFGEKDYQQLTIIKQMVRDLAIPVKILGCPTVRDADDLALSSRNSRMSVAERAKASALPKVMDGLAAALSDGKPAASRLADAKAALSEAGFQAIDYLALCRASDLTPLAQADEPARLLVAAWMGRTRLIDNWNVQGF